MRTPSWLPVLHMRAGGLLPLAIIMNLIISIMNIIKTLHPTNAHARRSAQSVTSCVKIVPSDREARFYSGSAEIVCLLFFSFFFLRDSKRSFLLLKES